MMHNVVKLQICAVYLKHANREGMVSEKVFHILCTTVLGKLIDKYLLLKVVEYYYEDNFYTKYPTRTWKQQRHLPSAGGVIDTHKHNQEAWKT